jgi:hypothetical protein
MKIDYIFAETTLAMICAQLVREGVRFRAYPTDSYWCIEFTGGY